MFRKNRILAFAILMVILQGQSQLSAMQRFGQIPTKQVVHRQTLPEDGGVFATTEYYSDGSTYTYRYKPLTAAPGGQTTNKIQGFVPHSQAMSSSSHTPSLISYPQAAPATSQIPRVIPFSQRPTFPAAPVQVSQQSLEEEVQPTVVDVDEAVEARRNIRGKIDPRHESFIKAHETFTKAYADKIKEMQDIEEFRKREAARLAAQKTFLESNFSKIAKFCFAYLPEHKAGGYTGPENYNTDHIEYFFGPNFSDFKKLIHQLSQVYGDKPEYYIEKDILNPDNNVIIMGDTHASLHSLLRNLYRLYNKGLLNDNFKLANNTRIVFTGDYINRGYYGLEVLAILARLKIENPSQVTLICGNHETFKGLESEGLRQRMQTFGFENEIANKYKNDDLLGEIQNKFFAKLPRSMFLGIRDSSRNIKWIQIVHGAVDLNFDLSQFLSSGQRIIAIPDMVARQYSWGEFNIGNNSNGRAIKSLALSIGLNDTKFLEYLRKYNIDKVCRAHDHNRGGISTLDENGNWTGILTKPMALNKVFTFMNCPEGLGYNDGRPDSNLNQDAFGIWRMIDNKWSLEPFIFNRSDYAGFNPDENASWYILPIPGDDASSVNFRLSPEPLM